MREALSATRGQPGADPGRVSVSRIVAVSGIAAVAALAIAIRALGIDWVFVGDRVIFPPADAQYHLRRAYWIFVNYPQILLTDTYVNYPGGAPIPWSPLLDIVMASTAKLATDTQRGFEIVAAWTPPALAALTTVPIYLTGRALSSRLSGIVAALLFALLPVSVDYSRLGQIDHHCAVAFIGAWLLFAVVSLAGAGDDRPRLLKFGLLLVLARTALLLTWHGGLLYVVITDGTLLALTAFAARPELARVHSASALGSLVLLVPIVLTLPEPLGGPYSSIALSWLHVSGILGIGVVSLSGLVHLRLRPESGLAMRLAVMGASGLVYALILLSLPGPREGLEPAMRFLTMTDEAGATTGEQSPLFAIFGLEARAGAPPAIYQWGLLAFLVPVAALFPLLAGLRERREHREGLSAFALAAFCAYFGFLTFTQRRYGNDLGPAASIAFGWALVALARTLGDRVDPKYRRAAVVGMCAVAVLTVMWTPIRGIYLPRAQTLLVRSSLGEAGRAGDLALRGRTVAGTIDFFMREVARLTPPTRGYLTTGESPEYGVIAHANLGHAIQYRAQRATATDPFWAYIGPENWERSLGFLDAKDEARALEFARELSARYVITMPGSGARTISGRLHGSNGSANREQDALGHFRLITEGPAGGAALTDLFLGKRPFRYSPYKLFEIVSGALLLVEARQAEKVYATIRLNSPSGRLVDYVSRATADETGRARLRLPYPTEKTSPVYAAGKYKVRVGDDEFALAVSEVAVVSGETIHLSGESDDD